MKSFDTQHTVTLPVEGVSQVWNGVATDNDILLYIADTLLMSFQDKKCLMELKTKYSDQPNNCCLCLAASLHPSTSELPGDLQALKKATLVLNEGGDDWSPWNIGE